MIETVLILTIFPLALMTITLHEISHGFVADYLGDPTPRNAGRLTLNPLKHIDPMGLLFLIIAKIGWAKPVPINPMNFENPLRDMALVGAAGPLMNFFIAYVLGALLRHDIVHLVPDTFTFVVFKIIMMMNIGLAVFNMIPVPPLDGSRILTGIIPQKYAMMLIRLERYFFVALLLIFILRRDILESVLTPPVNFFMHVFAGGYLDE